MNPCIWYFQYMGVSVDIKAERQLSPPLGLRVEPLVLGVSTDIKAERQLRPKVDLV